MNLNRPTLIFSSPRCGSSLVGEVCANYRYEITGESYHLSEFFGDDIHRFEHPLYVGGWVNVNIVPIKEEFVLSRKKEIRLTDFYSEIQDMFIFLENHNCDYNTIIDIIGSLPYIEKFYKKYKKIPNEFIENKLRLLKSDSKLNVYTVRCFLRHFLHSPFIYNFCKNEFDWVVIKRKDILSQILSFLLTGETNISNIRDIGDRINIESNQYTCGIVNFIALYVRDHYYFNHFCDNFLPENSKIIYYEDFAEDNRVLFDILNFSTNKIRHSNIKNLLNDQYIKISDEEYNIDFFENKKEIKYWYEMLSKCKYPDNFQECIDSLDETYDNKEKIFSEIKEIKENFNYEEFVRLNL